MRIYTTRGDKGQTDLLGERVEKDDPRIDLIGALDEATSSIGLGRALAQVTSTNERLVTVQRDLYQIMAELAFTDATRPDALHLGTDRTAWLEANLEVITGEITLPREFVLPGDVSRAVRSTWLARSSAGQSAWPFRWYGRAWWETRRFFAT